MRLLSLWLPLLGSVTVQTASLPSSDWHKRSETFRLGQVENADYAGSDAPTEMLKVHAKYGGTLSPALEEAIAMNPEMDAMFKMLMAAGGDMTGTIPNSPPGLYDIQYVVPVDIGTPPQRTMLNLDTGSSDFWTFSTDTYRPHVQKQTLYAPEDSSTSKLLRGQAWNIRYGDGAGASGIVYLDKVTMGGTSFDRQAVQAAVQVSRAITNDQFSSGIIGMGMSFGNTVRPNQQRTYIDNIKDDLAEPVFTSNLQKGRPGTYNFGYINESEYTGDIAYTPIKKNVPYWQITLDGYQVGKNEAGFYPWSAIVDTGTSLLLLPDVMVRYYWAQVDGARYDPYGGTWVFPCDAKLPDFHFLVGNHVGTVPGYYINYGKSPRGNGCYGGIQTADGVPFAVLGDILLKAQFVVFDIGEGRVGFAEKELVPED